MPQPTASQIHVDRMMTNVSVAYMQDDKNFVADKVFPVVPVEQQSDRYFLYSRADMFRNEVKERAPGTESAGGGWNVDNSPSYFCRQYAYHHDITPQDRVNATEPINVDIDASEWIAQKFLIHREALWVTKYFTTGIWTDLETGVNAGPGANQFVRWSVTGSTPIEDVTNAGIRMAQLTGLRPNTLVIGPWVYQILRNHAEIMGRIIYTQKGIVTLELLAALFDVERVLVPFGVINASAEGAAESNDFIYGKHALLCYSNPRPGLKRPSAGYTFAWKGMFGDNAYGMMVNRIPTPLLGVGSERLEGESGYEQKAVAADCGCFFDTAVA